MRKLSKREKAVLFLAGLVIIYLSLANYYIYFRIHQGGLTLPQNQHDYVLGEAAGAQAPLVYAALGDSLTSGVGTERYEESYPYRVASLLSSSGLPVRLKTYSYPGARTQNVIQDLLPLAIRDQPDIVTVLIGTNDIHGHVRLGVFEKNYDFILSRLSRETKAEVYVVSVPHLGSRQLLLPPYDRYFLWEEEQHNAILRQLCSKYGVTFIDLETPTREKAQESGYYCRDLFHPNTETYNLWAQIIYANLNK
jgi:lysophospholipase L1-like esterase